MLEFSKMHGCGNSFVVIEDLRSKIRNAPALARELCDYRKGIGADGLILARPSRRFDFTMAYFNGDGSRAEMCGNGIRCLAKFLADRGKLPSGTAIIETGAGPIVVRLIGKNRAERAEVLVDMGRPAFASRDLNQRGDGPFTALQVGKERFTFVSMGNPHAVCFVPKAPSDLATAGSRVENYRKLFPNKINVEYVTVLGKQDLRVRVWERGCGITAACGTGACASVVAAHLNAKIGAGPTRVRLDGGDLTITWRESDRHLLMQGEAVLVAAGRLIGT
jgi:diaminopimelate epimerase